MLVLIAANKKKLNIDENESLSDKRRLKISSSFDDSLKKQKQKKKIQSILKKGNIFLNPINL